MKYPAKNLKKNITSDHQIFKSNEVKSRLIIKNI